MFQSILASIGVGAARIDLVLNQDAITMGEAAEGTITLQGGKVEQQIEGLTVDFCLASRFEKDDDTVHVHETVARIPVSRETFTVHPDETKEFPFSFVCPEYIPVSSVTTQYYFQTNLEIQSGIDSQDRDFVDVYPSGLQKNFLEGFHHLGFVPYMEGYTGKKRNRLQIIQFQPTTWLRGQFDEVVFSYQTDLTHQSVSGFFELDKKTSGLTGMFADAMDLDERKGRYSFDADDLATPEQAAETIRNFIIRHTEDLITG
ncbi:sporulation protein [Paludifilum halophilum]|uniref:Sporulation protein SpoOM n=1 Tax=Paludifilum halophilum TaxID=1642702 RepID=A0A235B6G2_9BACL|nr:sporulation protein [Paludifilum halophilum]OYD07831.1 hypothetical protein CHM34_10280 [Paludifilum halophilum]